MKSKILSSVIISGVVLLIADTALAGMPRKAPTPTPTPVSHEECHDSGKGEFIENATLNYWVHDGKLASLTFNRCTSEICYTWYADGSYAEEEKKDCVRERVEHHPATSSNTRVRSYHY